MLTTYGTEGPGREKSSVIVLYFFKVRSRCATDHFSKLLAVKFIWPILFLGIMGDFFLTHQTAIKMCKT